MVAAVKKWLRAHVRKRVKGPPCTDCPPRSVSGRKRATNCHTRLDADTRSESSQTLDESDAELCGAADYVRPLVSAAHCQPFPVYATVSVPRLLLTETAHDKSATVGYALKGDIVMTVNPSNDGASEMLGVVSVDPDTGMTTTVCPAAHAGRFAHLVSLLHSADLSSKAHGDGVIVPHRSEPPPK